MLDLTGHLNTVPAPRGFSLEGRFRLPMASLLTGRPDATGLGSLRGRCRTCSLTVLSLPLFRGVCSD
jgi:hypothetical protein